jgi:acyl-CoA reductase-like NAD-dependent aldehyde dehydrogenase
VATIVRPEVATYQHYIDGDWTSSAAGETFEVLNPSTEEVVALAPAGTREDARRAIAAARRSYDGGEWRNKSQLQRSQVMFEIAKHLQDRSGEWAPLESQTAGATIPLASFGGYRQSGNGRELGAYGLREYTEVKHIHVDQNVPRRERYFYDVLLG